MVEMALKQLVVWTLLCPAVFVVSAPALTAEEDQKDEPSLKIIGGTPAAPGEFPFVVSLQSRPQVKHECGAVLVDLTHLVTAATCVAVPIPNNFQVAAGAYEMADVLLGHQQLRRIKSITLHPQFDPQGDDHDVAVLELYNAFSLSSTVEPLPLSRTSLQQHEYPGVCTIAGWGATSKDAERSDKLYKGNVTVHPRSLCKNAYPGQYDETLQICANGQNEQGELVEACSGDMGGPLLCSQNGVTYLAGISSWGYICGHPDKPGVYMELSKYRSWIESVISLTGGGDEEDETTVAPTTTTTTRKPNNAENATVSEGDLVGNKPVGTGCR